MHVDTIRSHQKAADGTVREYRSHLLRHSFRDEQGRPRKETLANLTALPDAALEAVRTVLRGEAVVSAGDAFTVERSVSHGDAAVACVMAGQLGLRELLGPACAERDIAYALIVSRAVRVGCQNLCRASDLVGLEYSIVAVTCFFSWQRGPVMQRSGTRG